MIENIIVKSVEDTGKTWKNPKGEELKIRSVTLEDGREGTTLSGKIVVGPAKIEIIEGQFGLNFKYVDEGRPSFNQSPPRNDALIVRQVAMKAAVEMACAGVLEENKSIYQQADDIVEWINK